MGEEIDSDNEEPGFLRIQKLMKFDADNNPEDEDDYSSLDEFTYWL